LQDEDKDTGTEIHEGSVIRFFINGKDQGKAFENIQAGIYYPAASVYMNGQVTYNFGPGTVHTHSWCEQFFVGVNFILFFSLSLFYHFLM